MAHPHRTLVFDIPYVVPNQVRAEEFHNNAFFQFDAFVQISVISRLITDPPATPAEGDRYWIPVGGTGDWENRDGQIAYYVTPPSGQGVAGWKYWTAPIGTLIYVQAESAFFNVSASAVLTELGTSGSGNDSVVVREDATATITHATAGSWENALAYTVPANSLLSNQVYRFSIFGYNQVATAARDLSIRATFDGNTLWQDTRTYSASTDRSAFELHFWLWADGANNKQGFAAIFHESQVTGSSSPFGEIGAGQVRGCGVDIDDVTVDATGAADFDVDLQWAAGAGSATWIRDFYTVERLF